MIKLSELRGASVLAARIDELERMLAVTKAQQPDLLSRISADFANGLPYSASIPLGLWLRMLEMALRETARELKKLGVEVEGKDEETKGASKDA